MKYFGESCDDAVHAACRSAMSVRVAYFCSIGPICVGMVTAQVVRRWYCVAHHTRPACLFPLQVQSAFLVAFVFPPPAARAFGLARCNGARARRAADRRKA